MPPAPGALETPRALDTSRTLEMTATERLAARYVTGPLGHFVAGAIDLAIAVAEILFARARAMLSSARLRHVARRRDAS